MICLVGPHGAGKSTIGRLLATHLGGKHLGLGDLGRLCRSGQVPADVPPSLIAIVSMRTNHSILAPADYARGVVRAMPMLAQRGYVSLDGFPDSVEAVDQLPSDAGYVSVRCGDAERESRLLARSRTTKRGWTTGGYSKRDAAIPDILDALLVHGVPGMSYLNDAGQRLDDEAIQPIVQWWTSRTQ